MKNAGNACRLELSQPYSLAPSRYVVPGNSSKSFIFQGSAWRVKRANKTVLCRVVLPKSIRDFPIRIER